MLTLVSDRNRDCRGLTRRSLLQAGTLGLGSLTLPWLFRQRAHGAEGFVRDKAVVLLFLGGGPSHIETFNPNLDAPAPYCSVTGEVATSIPGITLGGTFPQLARHADKLALVRSFRHPVGGHVEAIKHVLTGGHPGGASLGSVYSRLRGTNHRRTGMPTYSLLTAPETDRQYRSEKNRIIRGSSAGELGANYQPFDPDGDGESIENMTLNVPPERLDDRRGLLGGLDRLKRHAEATGALRGADRFRQQAFDLILGGAAEAFDLTQEAPRLAARYDTSSIRVGNHARRPKDVRPSVLGKQMLLARRLIERGCGFVTVQSAGWDMHADGNNPGIVDGMQMLGGAVDKAVSAFLEDLAQRGMLDRVLLVITGDFGRTPRINKRGGRDHWANLCTLAFAGGGVQTGRVIGRAARRNDEPDSDPISTADVMATVMHALFDLGALRLERNLPSDLARFLESGRPIPLA